MLLGYWHTNNYLSPLTLTPVSSGSLGEKDDIPTQPPGVPW